MDETEIEAPGVVANPEDLQTSRGQELCRLLSVGQIDYAQLVEVRRDGEDDVVVFDVEVELGQLKRHPIRAVERLAVKISGVKDTLPETLALRTDFPATPHLNLRFDEFPRSLCLYDQPYEDFKHQWTAPRHVERARSWLALTAKGKLHHDDQPLEPLLWGDVGQIVLPDDIMSRAETDRQLAISATSLDSLDLFLTADADGSEQKGSPYFPVLVTCPVKTHGVIRFRPRTLAKLAELVDTQDFSLLSVLRDRIKEAKDCFSEADGGRGRFLGSSLVILLAMPKSRVAGGDSESVDLWAFLTGATIRSVGLDIGIWTEVDRNLGVEPYPPEGKTGAGTKLDLLNPRFSLSADSAASLNNWGLPEPAPRITAVGAGSLGSHVLLNAKRSGLSVSTIIDEDRLLPHNLARHALPGAAMGHPKAEMMALLLDDIFSHGDSTEAIVANVVRPRDKEQPVKEAFSNADLILDMSASVAVGRSLANDVRSDARRVSMFLNPSGEDLVVLAEDAERTCSLDMLEMQFYRALLSQETLEGHFKPTDNRQRYGQSCRDVTSRTPQDLMAVQGGIGARALRRLTTNRAAQIVVWRTTDDLEVKRIEVTPSRVIQHRVSDWTVKLDATLVERLKNLREAKLPNETGGVLLGSFDMGRRIAYIVDTIPSPPDSDEWPTLYIRGSRGLRHKVEAVVEQTDGALHYVGEWHSHPERCTTKPSVDDMQVFAWLTERVGRDGHPGLMLIVGDRDQLSTYIGEIVPAAQLVPLSVA